MTDNPHQGACQLEEEGIEELVRPYDNSLWTLRQKAIALREPVGPNRVRWSRDGIVPG